jgi:ferredoxin-NADP reductase/DMSO/TMAO reductase YedYZ heme-binding membrane subunit
MKVTRFARVTVLLNCAVPVALLGWDAFWGQLGANPVDFSIRTTGLLALLFLILTLLVTPVSRRTGWNWLGPFRRMFGLIAFAHAGLHFLIFVVFDRGGSFSDAIAEIGKRPYLMVGTFALALMVPLAATSTDEMIRLLGGRRWKALHRLTYIVAVFGALHFYMLVKADVTRPLAFAGVIGVLLGYRAVSRLARLRSGPRAGRSTPTKMKYWKGSLRVARVVDETPDVRTIRLAPVSGTRLPFDFLPGQYLNLMLTIDGKRVNRSYTIASSPTRVDWCEVTVKREPHGVSSRYLHDTVREGSLLDVAAPAGRFTFTGVEDESIVLIAGGVGVTPLMSKIRYLTDKGWPGEIHLVFAAKTERDVIFREELDDLQRSFPNLRVTVTLTRDDGSNWRGERGRISADLLSRVVPQLSSRRVHLCGPQSMMDQLTGLLKGLGVPEDRIKVESFVRPTRPEPALVATGPAVAGNGSVASASITFSLAGKSAPIPARQTVLEAADDLGVAIPFDCRAGVCGRCKTRLLAGRVVMEVEAALDDLDRAENLILACQARCLDEVVVEA